MLGLLLLVEHLLSRRRPSLAHPSPRGREACCGSKETEELTVEVDLMQPGWWSVCRACKKSWIQSQQHTKCVRQGVPEVSTRESSGKRT